MEYKGKGERDTSQNWVEKVITKKDRLDSHYFYEKWDRSLFSYFPSLRF